MAGRKAGRPADEVRGVYNFKSSLHVKLFRFLFCLLLLQCYYCINCISVGLSSKDYCKVGF